MAPRAVRADDRAAAGQRAGCCNAPTLPGVSMTDRPRFNPRAARRLCIAGVLMRWLPLGAEPGTQACERILGRIRSLDDACRDRLRGQVDWVEAYERTEADQQRKTPGRILHRNG